MFNFNKCELNGGYISRLELLNVCQNRETRAWVASIAMLLQSRLIDLVLTCSFLEQKAESHLNEKVCSVLYEEYSYTGCRFALHFQPPVPKLNTLIFFLYCSNMKYDRCLCF